MALFYGNLVQNKDLVKTARLRGKKYHEVTVSKDERDAYLAQGWTVGKELKTRVKMHKEKERDELLEDEVWLLFWNMGFSEMNEDRNFKIKAGPTIKQIDIFASDENKVFVVECKASLEGARISQKDIREISDMKKDITDSIRKQYENNNIRVYFVIATKGMRWTKVNEELASRRKIFVWQEAELEYYSELAKHLGNSAKFQLYSILFRDNEAPELANIKVPAIYGGREGAKYYSFIIQPEKLLKVAYIHHRRGTPREILYSYQRMLEKSRLTEIDRFITGGGYFPNNIVINFTKKPKFNEKAKVGDLVYGVLTFPPYYASAWVIDGQHRLYGYANNEKKSRDTLPVLAFDSLDVKLQARLFVEINKKQKPVAANLLWDLYPDIYHDSTEEKQQIQRTISLIVRKLNSHRDSPLRDHIKIPSMPTRGGKITNITMATVCDALEENRLIDRDQILLYKDDYDSTVDFASERLKAYFSVIAKSFPTDWEKGNQGLLRTNIGIRILFIILRQLMLYLRNTGQAGIYAKKDLGEFKSEIQKLLNPMLANLKRMSDADRSRIRKATAKGLVLGHAQQMVLQIRDQFEDFGSDLLRSKAKAIPIRETDESISKLLEDTERELRALIAIRLEKLHGPPWWRRGIPAGVKKYVQEQIDSEMEEAPYRRDHLRSLPPDERLDYTTTGQLRDILMYGSNWQQFQEVFSKNKEETLFYFKFFERLRHVYRHHRERVCDEITRNLGYWSMKWIRACIGLEKEGQGQEDDGT